MKCVIGILIGLTVAALLARADIRDIFRDTPDQEEK